MKKKVGFGMQRGKGKKINLSLTKQRLCSSLQAMLWKFKYLYQWQSLQMKMTMNNKFVMPSKRKKPKRTILSMNTCQSVYTLKERLSAKNTAFTVQVMKMMTIYPKHSLKWRKKTTKMKMRTCPVKLIANNNWTKKQKSKSSKNNLQKLKNNKNSYKSHLK